MFFYNIFIGIVSCLMRIAYAMVLGTLMLSRLDYSTLPRRFESMDPGKCMFSSNSLFHVAYTVLRYLLFKAFLFLLSKTSFPISFQLIGANLLAYSCSNILLSCVCDAFTSILVCKFWLTLLIVCTELCMCA